MKANRQMAVNIFTSSSLTSWSETRASSSGPCDHPGRWDTPRKKNRKIKKPVPEVGIVRSDKFLPIKHCRVLLTLPRLTGGWLALPCVRDWSLVIPPQLLQGTRCVGFKRLVKKKKNSSRLHKENENTRAFQISLLLAVVVFNTKEKKIRLQEGERAAAAAPPL